MSAAKDRGAGLSLGVIAPDLSAAGGAERLALHCVARWQQRHRITLYSSAFDEPLLDELGVSPEVQRKVLPSRLTRDPIGGSLARLADALLFPRIWAREVGNHDVYLGHQWRTLRIDRAPFVWYSHETHRDSYDLLRERGSDTVAREMGDLLQGPDAVPADQRHAILQDALRHVDAGVAPDRVVANSRFTAALLEQTLGLRGAEVVYPGVDPDGFLEPRFDEPYFLSVGSLLPHKRNRLAIEALTLLQDARLVLAGRGRLQPDLERMAAKLGVSDRVEVRTDVDDEELRRLYAGCRAVVFTPFNEPFGMVALECLAAGKPLVAVDQGGFTEIVDASCAALVSPEPPALAAAMQALLDRPEEAQRMGEAGRKLARAWSWDRTADELETIVIDTHRQAIAIDARPGTQAWARVPRPAMPAPPVRPEVGVRLALDYGEGAAEGDWRRAGATDEMPRAGFYAAHHESTLRRQLAQIEECGFDFVLLSLWLDDHRLSPFGALAVRHAFELAPELGSTARFAVELVSNQSTPPLVEAALDWLSGMLRDRSHRFEIEGRPLVLLRGANEARLRERPELCLRRAPAPGEGGELRAVSLAGGADLAQSLTPALAAPAPTAVIVSSWNDYTTGAFLEPTVREGDRRREAARSALEAR